MLAKTVQEGGSLHFQISIAVPKVKQFAPRALPVDRAGFYDHAGPFKKHQTDRIVGKGM